MERLEIKTNNKFIGKLILLSFLLFLLFIGIILLNICDIKSIYYDCRLLKECGSNFNTIKYIDTHQYNNSLINPVCRLLKEIYLNERNQRIN